MQQVPIENIVHKKVWIRLHHNMKQEDVLILQCPTLMHCRILYTNEYFEYNIEETKEHQNAINVRKTHSGRNCRRATTWTSTSNASFFHYFIIILSKMIFSKKNWMGIINRSGYTIHICWTLIWYWRFKFIIHDFKRMIRKSCFLNIFTPFQIHPYLFFQSWRYLLLQDNLRQSH